MQSITELRNLAPRLNYHLALNSGGKGDQGTEQNRGQPAAVYAFTVSLWQGPEVKSLPALPDPEERMDIIALVEGNYRHTEEIKV